MKILKSNSKIFDKTLTNLLLQRKKRIKSNSISVTNIIREAKKNIRTKDWKLLKKYKNSISNKKLNINLYYKFSNKIPSSFIWYSIDKNKEFIPTFTKKIFRQVSVLF